MHSSVALNIEEKEQLWEEGDSSVLFIFLVREPTALHTMYAS
jgi:hypothetical protein